MDAAITTAAVQSSFLEYEGAFKEPIFEAWSRPHTLLAHLYQALRQVGVKLSDISRESDDSKVASSHISVSLLGSRLLFKIGVGGVSASLVDPNWQEADLIASLMTTSLHAALKGSGGELQQHVVTMALHVLPHGRTPVEVLSPFVNFGSRDEAVTGYGFAVYRQELHLVADYSWLYAGSVFLRITRSFQPSATFREMASSLHADEISFGKALGLEIL